MYNISIIIFLLDGFEKYTQRVPKSSINEGLLTTFHRQEQKLLGFWVFFVVLQWVFQLSVKQMMVQVLRYQSTNLRYQRMESIRLGFLR